MFGSLGSLGIFDAEPSGDVNASCPAGAMEVSDVLRVRSLILCQHL